MEVTGEGPGSGSGLRVGVEIKSVQFHIGVKPRYPEYSMLI